MVVSYVGCIALFCVTCVTLNFMINNFKLRQILGKIILWELHSKLLDVG